MSTNEQYPSTNDGSTSEQIPHSGVHGYETPVTEFDKTSLKDAHDQGLLTVPENPGTLTSKDKKVSPFKKAGVALGSLAAVVALGIGAKSALGGESTESQSTTGNSAPANAGETEKAEQAFEFGIPAAEFQNNPEALVQEYYNQINALRIAGATEQAAKSDRAYEISKEEFVNEFSAPIDADFAEALLIDNWQSNPDLAEYFTTEFEIANRTRELRILSFGGGTNAIEQYEREKVMTSAEGTLDPLTTSSRYTERDNAEMTIVKDNLDGQDVNTMGGGETITWVNVDGQLKISDITYFAG